MQSPFTFFFNTVSTGRMAAVIAGLLMLSFQVPQTFAHSLYIQSTQYFADEDKSLPLYFCYGHYVPVADGLRGKKLNRVNVVSPDGTATPITVRDEKSLHSYMVNYDAPGTWTLTAETTPGYYTVYTDKKGKERHTIKPMAKIMDRAKEVHKSYFAKQYAKTYVNCERPSATFPARAGLALELVPRTDLFTLKPGDNLELDVYLDGKPYTGKGTWDGTYMGFSTVAEDNFYPKTEVEGSRISVALPDTGRWFIRYFIKKDAPEADKDKYLQMKLTATLTFQIDNERKTPEPEGH
ncbi:MAG: DUF4198 domain-containing protein [Desulfobacterales bacterium]|nr:DUF4198 domain-containing protein [Desulfobacterales bacterium]